MSFEDASLRFMESISITFLLYIGLTSPLQRNGGRENFAVSVISAWPAYPSKSTSGETDGAQFLEIFVRGGCFAGFTSPEKGRMMTSASSAPGGIGISLRSIRISWEPQRGDGLLDRRRHGTRWVLGLAALKCQRMSRDRSSNNELGHDRRVSTRDFS